MMMDEMERWLLVENSWVTSTIWDLSCVLHNGGMSVRRTWYQYRVPVLEYMCKHDVAFVDHFFGFDGCVSPRLYSWQHCRIGPTYVGSAE